MDKIGDQAFRATANDEAWVEMTYGGALSYLRRRYSRDFEGVDVVVSGVPYDSAVTYRPGARLGPRAVREASVQLAELPSFPYGFNPLTELSIVDAGDCRIDPHYPDQVAGAIEAHAAGIIASGARAPRNMARLRWFNSMPIATLGKMMARGWIMARCLRGRWLRELWMRRARSRWVCGLIMTAIMALRF